jgi:hypothetical protein
MNINAGTAKWFEYLEKKFGPLGRNIFYTIFHPSYGWLVQSGIVMGCGYGIYKIIRSTFEFIVKTPKTQKNFNKF